MRSQILETDWKLFRKLHGIALERFCQQTLTEVNRLAADGSRSNHERYLAVADLLKHESKKMRDTFDDPRRSTALEQLVYMHLQGLLTKEELALLSDETRDIIRKYLSVYRAEARYYEETDLERT